MVGFIPREEEAAVGAEQLNGQVGERLIDRLEQDRFVQGLVGTRTTVLIENKEKGHSNGFAPVRIAGSARGDLGPALITAVDGDILIGTFE